MMRTVSVIVILSFIQGFPQIYSAGTCSLSSSSGECVKYAQCRFALFFGSHNAAEIKNRKAACQLQGRDLLCCEKAGAPVFNNVAKTTKRTTTNRPGIKSTLKPLGLRPNQLGTTIANNNQNSPTRKPFNVALEQHPNFKRFDNKKCGPASVNRIANGENAKLFEFPWAAQLGYRKKNGVEYDCGGSLITAFSVLTAAHCIAFLPSNLKLEMVRLGEYDTKKIQDCDEDDPDDPECADPVQDIRIASVAFHPGFGDGRVAMLNDIGIVHLASAANLKQNNIKTLCLPFASSLHQLPEKLIAIGWGRTEKSSSSAILQKVTLPLHNDIRTCEKKLTSKAHFSFLKITSDQFCAGGEGKTDTCRGDSGSPIQTLGMVDGKPRFVQYGIVSYGVSTCGKEFGIPGVYTNVAKYLNWILDNAQ